MFDGTLISLYFYWFGNFSLFIKVNKLWMLLYNINIKYEKSTD